MPMVQLSEALFARAQSHAIPLVDDLESVISRAFDALETLGKKEGQTAPETELLSIRTYNPKTPPNLAFSQPVSIKVDNEDVPYGQLYWNNLMYQVISKAVAAGYTGDRLRALMVVPNVLGIKEDQGYKHLEAAGISVQGQDANGAWKQTFHLAEHLGLKLSVVWRWQTNEKASLPGQKGSFTVG